MYTQIYNLYKYNKYHHILLQSDKIPLSLLLRLNNPSSISLSLCVRCCSPFINFKTFHWTHSSMPVSLLYWGAHSIYSLSGGCWIEGEDHLSWSSDNAALVLLCCRGVLLPHGPAEPPTPSLQTCFPVSHPPACTGEYGYSFPGAEIYRKG